MLVIGAQLLVTILLFIVGLLNKKEKWSTKSMLIVNAVIFILLSVWGFYASTLDFGVAVNSIGFTKLLFILISAINIIIASLSIYACLNKN
jgi:hypothetical protein